MNISKAVCACLLAMACGAAVADDAAAQKQVIERGRYLISTSSCNDCHTPGYPESGGMLPAFDQVHPGAGQSLKRRGQPLRGGRSARRWWLESR